jgi:phosphoglycolate phosphatase
MATFPLLVLDLDGTLVDSLPDLTGALNRLMTARDLLTFQPAAIKPMIGDGTKKLLERAFGARGQRPRIGDHDLFVADYTSHVAAETHPYPQVDETLAALQAVGWRFAICTNKSIAATEALLKALGLRHWFAALGCGDSFAAHKPDPVHLLGTVAAANGTPGRALMVGDHANDVAAARAAAIPAIFAAWGYGNAVVPPGTAAVAQHFAELAVIAPRLMP